ncbi:hypothetical protein G7Y89_g9130 [Cudoniella acicularis]|uniref:Uncharacterized protein n=1 Tax=Cudoniella acicularis TaxID=354080 RepID=A0A8H4W0C3_9HELO|nr:hypothetical protein G7Y89_g9130 [Cudoniella acicularis]
MAEKQSYKPLMQDDDISIDYEDLQTKFARKPLFLQPRISMLVILIILLAISFTTNILQAWLYNRVKTAETLGLSKYSKLRFNTNSVWYVPPEERNQTQEELLEAISLDDGAIVVSKEWAKEMDLAESSIFPWDDSKLVYFLHAYHGLHCVKLLYRFVKEIRDDEPRTTPLEHVIHCLDATRQDIICNADDTPRPRRYKENTADPLHTLGEPRKCRDWSALETWARERNACYQASHADPTDMLHSQLKYCASDSPYLPAVREYYGKEYFRARSPYSIKNSGTGMKAIDTNASTEVPHPTPRCAYSDGPAIGRRAPPMQDTTTLAAMADAAYIEKAVHKCASKDTSNPWKSIFCGPAVEKET